MVLVAPQLASSPTSGRRTRARASARAWRVLGLALVLMNASCSKACKNDHPYVPYSVDGELADASADGGTETTAALGDAGALATSAEPALAAPANARTWNVEGLELVAPPERELLYAIVRDMDGDGKKDALALVRPPAPAGKPNEVGAAEIVFYAGASPTTPSVVAAAPVPRIDAACTPLARLERVGARSALVEVGTTCTRGPSARALFVVRLSKSPTVAFDLGIVDPPGAPKFAIDVDADDRDHDGIDDVTLRLTIEGGAPPFEPGPKLSAKLAFFDRSAGPSRDPDEPEASLKAIAAQATARAGKAREAATVPVLVEQMRMLYRAMCVEGGAPRLVKLRGLARASADPNANAPTGAVSCGASKPLEDAGVAEVRAFVAQADALRAVAAADRAQVSPATKTAARTAEIAKLLAEVAPFVTARSTRVAAITLPTKRSPHPEWGALGFEPSGKLLVRGPSAVLRVNPDSGESTDAEMPPWPTQVLSPDGKSRWLEAYHACEGVGLRATFAPIDGDSEMRDVLLPIAPPLGSRCAGGRGEAATTIPIAWGTRGLEALVSGQPLLVRPEASTASIMASPLGEMPPFGSPRSAGGRAMAVATKEGVLVKTTKAARYRGADFEPYTELGQCTTTDDGAHIACVKRGRVVMGTFDAL